MPNWTHSDTMEANSSHVVGNMSKTDILRGVITEKLTTAAREILAVLERTVTDYEEEASAFRQEIDRQRRQLELLQPEIKIEPIDDQLLFSFCEAGGREVTEEEQQHKYELRVEDSRSLGLCNEEEPMEEDGEEQEEQQVTEQQNETTKRLFPPGIKSEKKRVSRSQACDLEEYVPLRVRILEDSEIKVLSRKIFKKFPLRKLKCPCGLQEADFVNLLKSTFPQLAENRAYDIFMTDKTKKLLPLKVDSFTPEQLSVTLGNSSLYIRLKCLGEPLSKQKDHLQNSEEEEEEEEEELEVEEDQEEEEQEEEENDAEDPPSTHHLITSNTKRYMPRESIPKGPINLRVRILDDSSIEAISPRVFSKYRFRHLRCPRGLREADFFKLLRSTYSELAGDRPFTVLTSKGKLIRPLGVRCVTPEEIVRHSKSDRNPVIYIRLEPRVNLEPRQMLNPAAEVPPSNPDPPTLNTNIQSDERTSGRTPSSESHNHIDLRIRILEDPSTDTISPIVYQKYPLLELQCPGGMTEEAFLDLLRSTFPQLANEAFDFLTGYGRKIRLIKVEKLTPEEINKTIKSAGNTVLYIRLKGQGEVQGSAKKHLLPFSHQTKLSMSVNPAVITQSGLGFQSFQVPSSSSSLDKDLRGIILRAMPTITEETLQALIQKLFNAGLESTQDLNYVRPEDFGDLLPTTQLQRLFEEFKNETNSIISDPEIIHNPPPGFSSASGLISSSPSSLLSLPNPEASSSDCGPSFPIMQTWPELFQVPWNLMPIEICKAVAAGKRPSPGARRHMVRVLVDEMRKHDISPKRSHCITICRNIIRQYPQSFADLHDMGKLLGDGCTSLVTQLKNRIDNVNRSSGFHQYRSSGNGLKRGPVDTYGCTRFQPGLPQGETDETIEQKRQRLVEIYHHSGADGAEGEEVQHLMGTTFCLQRRHINALPAPAIADLREQWPYLFTQKGLHAHFEILTEVCVLLALDVSIEDCGRTIVQFFLNKPTNADVQAVLSQMSNLDPAFCVIQLLMAHFSENLDGLILFASASSTAADIERTLALPTTPRLILLVSNETPGSWIHRWMISLEGQVICEGFQPSFLDGLAAVFSTYYTFNLRYEDDAVCTLEFIQRKFVGINPGTGTKAGREKLSKLTGKVAQRKMTPVNPRVLSLLQKLMDSNSPRNRVEEAGKRRKVQSRTSPNHDGEDRKSSGSIGPSSLQPPTRKNKMSDKEDCRKPNGNIDPETVTEQQHADVKIKSQWSESAVTDDKDALLSCKVCQLLRGSVNMLTKHAWCHVDGLNKLCGVCGEQSETAEELRKHLHSHQKTQSCNICGKSFLTAAGFKGHMDLHKGNKPFKCKVCHKAFAVKSVLKTHQLVHMKDKPHKCDVCQQSFISPVRLKVHRLSHADGNDNHSQESLPQHADTPHSSRLPGKGKPRSCEVCGKKFNTEERLRTHLKKHNKRMFACTKCNKMFVFKSCLIGHMKVHSDDKFYRCNVCGMLFNQLTSWTKHQKDHQLN